MSNAIRGRMFRTASAVILLVGWTMALFMYFGAAYVFERDPAGHPVIERAPPDVVVERTARDTLALKRMGGQANVMAADFSEWLGSLWHGRRLAWTIATASAALALLFAHAARLADDDDHD